MCKSSKVIFTTLLAVILSVSEPARANELYDFYNGVRGLGMGGTYVAVVNDETSLLSNPAGLGRLRDSIFTILDPEISGSTNVTEITNINSMNAQTPSDLLALLRQHPGKHWFAKAQVFPSAVAPNVGFGIHGKVKYDAEVNATSTNFRLDYTDDRAAILGICFRFWGGIIKLGATGRYMNRAEIHKDIDPTVTSIDMNQTASEGTGIASDVGLILTAPIAWLPTLAVVLRDAGRTTYKGNGMFLQTQTRPEDTPASVDVGYALHPIVSNSTRITFALDYHDATNVRNDQDPMKRVHGGIEFNFSDIFFLRGGMNQRYWTSGLELATPWVQFQLATYGEEIGTKDAPKEDRRFVGKFSVRF